MISLDPTRQLRSRSELQELVRAVYNADPLDESRHIEWKTQVDSNLMLVAKAILGMANRSVADAAGCHGGLGYVLVGVEPGHLPGVETVDLAVVGQRLDRFVGRGDQGPRWNPTFVDVDRISVLVIIVEAPQPGDPIFTLRTEGTLRWPDGRVRQTYREGTVFVRLPARTDQACSADMDALVARARASRGDGAMVEVVIDRPVPWFDLGSLRSINVQMLGDQVPAPVSAVTTDDEPSLVHSDLTRMLASAVARSFERRTPKEYNDSVDAWRERWRESALKRARRIVVMRGQLNLELRNPSEVYLKRVQVEIRFDPAQCDFTFLGDAPAGARLPDPPTPFGTMVDPLWSLTPLYSLAGLVENGLGLPIPPAADCWTSDDQHTIYIDVDELRPYATYRTRSELYVVFAEPPETGFIRGSWTATAAGRNGRMAGHTELYVDTQPTSFDDLVPEILGVVESGDGSRS